MRQREQRVQKQGRRKKHVFLVVLAECVVPGGMCCGHRLGSDRKRFWLLGKGIWTCSYRKLDAPVGF